jgi:cytochrome P450
MIYQNVVADHDRLRQLFLPHFSPRAIEAYRPVVRNLVDTLLVPLRDKADIELVGEFAFPLPMLVIARMLGVPIEDLGHFQHVMEELLAATANIKALDAATFERRDRLTQELLNLFSHYLEERRRSPKDDLISKLADAAARGGISDEDLIAQFVFIMIAGHSTTADMIGNALLALDAHPDQREALSNGEVSVRDSIAELLRYETSLEGGTRCITESLEISGAVLPQGARALILFPSAHHDPEVFEEPDRLNLHRTFPEQAFPFGAGRYFCLGSVLAKLELEEALEGLVRRMPPLTTVELEWQGGLISHGPKRLLMAR